MTSTARAKIQALCFQSATITSAGANHHWNGQSSGVGMKPTYALSGLGVSGKDGERLLSPCIRLLFSLSSPLVLPIDRPPADRESAEAAGTRRWSRPAHEYNSNTGTKSHTNRGSRSVRVPGYELENSPHQGPAIRPGHTGQKTKDASRVFSRRLFFPLGWNRRWKRSLTRTLSVVSCLGGQGGVAGGGEFVCVDGRI